MDNKVSDFLKNLEESLAKFPDDEKKDVLLYYEEYLYDANESGKDMDEVLKNLGSPRDIAELLLAEESLDKAQRKPGIWNFSKAVKNIFMGVSNPIGYVFRGLYLLIIYSLLIIFLGGALAFFLGSLASLAGILYEMFQIPQVFKNERLGTLGIALFTSCILYLLAYTFYTISRRLIVTSAQTIRRMLRKKVHKKTYGTFEEEECRGFSGWIGMACFIVIVGGLTAAIISGLPFRLFFIFSGMRPDKVNMVVNEYSVVEVENISINTAHSCIRVVNDKDNFNKIIIRYEQPDWLDYQTSIEGETVVFNETSNGRLPFFNLVSLHESRTEATLYLPAGFHAEKISIESKGGLVVLEDIVQNVAVNTYTGSITLDNLKTVKPYNVKAKTEEGIIESEWLTADSEQQKDFSLNRNAEKTIELSSTRGNIVIK